MRVIRRWYQSWRATKAAKRRSDWDTGEIDMLAVMRQSQKMRPNRVWRH